MKILKVYECRRYKKSSGDAWCGCLIIAAEDECKAWAIFINREYGSEPSEIIEMDGVFATGEERILYNDYER